MIKSTFDKMNTIQKFWIIIKIMKWWKYFTWFKMNWYYEKYYVTMVLLMIMKSNLLLNIWTVCQSPPTLYVLFDHVEIHIYPSFMALTTMLSNCIYILPKTRWWSNFTSIKTFIWSQKRTSSPIAPRMHSLVYPPIAATYYFSPFVI